MLQLSLIDELQLNLTLDGCVFSTHETQVVFQKAGFVICMH